VKVNFGDAVNHEVINTTQAQSPFGEGAVAKAKQSAAFRSTVMLIASPDAVCANHVVTFF
jgi:hypothetical protein